MKITKEQLREMIKEELLGEAASHDLYKELSRKRIEIIKLINIYRNEIDDDKQVGYTVSAFIGELKDNLKRTKIKVK